eukprot:m.18550 g.18550  ORF g.18550 m.18550 type:complete len:133 (+) comp8327_c0_seq2:335-733(+)
MGVLETQSVATQEGLSRKHQILQMIRSAHCTITMLTKYEVCAARSNLISCQSWHICIRSSVLEVIDVFVIPVCTETNKTWGKETTVSKHNKVAEKTCKRLDHANLKAREMAGYMSVPRSMARIMIVLSGSGT